MSTNKPLYSSLGDDPDVAELVELFVDGLPQRLRQLETEYSQADWPSLRRTAHQLKGAAGSYGFPHLTAALSDLEAHASRQADAEEMDLQFATLRSLFARTRSGVPLANCDQVRLT